MKSTVGAALGLLLAAAAQVALAPRMAIFGARPDFLLVAVTLLSMGRSTDGAAVVGAFAGLLHGGAANARTAAYVISRILGGISASLVGRTRVAVTPLTVAASSLAATGVASVAFLLLAAPKVPLAWLLSTFGTLAYNTVLVVAIFWIFRGWRGRP